MGRILRRGTVQVVFCVETSVVGQHHCRVGQVGDEEAEACGGVWRASWQQHEVAEAEELSPASLGPLQTGDALGVDCSKCLPHCHLVPVLGARPCCLQQAQEEEWVSSCSQVIPSSGYPSLFSSINPFYRRQRHTEPKCLDSEATAGPKAEAGHLCCSLLQPCSNACVCVLLLNWRPIT